MFAIIAVLWLAWILAGVAASAYEEFRDHSAVRAARVRVRHGVRMAWLRVVWAVRSRRGAAVLRARLVMVDVRRRWGFLRGASVLTWVCVPVWAVRYGVWERWLYLCTAWSLIRYAFSPSL
jgi:hypothetical protein